MGMVSNSPKRVNVPQKWFRIPQNGSEFPKNNLSNKYIRWL